MRSASAKFAAPAARRGRRRDELLDLLDGNRRVARLRRFRSARTPSTRSNCVKRLANGRAVGRAQLPRIDRGIELAHEIEEHAERTGRIQIGGNVAAEMPPAPAARRPAIAGLAGRAGSESRRDRKSVSRVGAILPPAPLPPTRTATACGRAPEIIGSEALTDESP